jgi:hypothetical protein
MKRLAPSPVPELWRSDVGGASVAVVNIPGSLERHRTFDVDVTLVVRVPLVLDGAWHALTVELDGKQQWSRRIDSNSPGQTDGLDYHCRIELAPGGSLRVRAAAGVSGSVVKQLCVEAREELTG